MSWGKKWYREMIHRLLPGPVILVLIILGLLTLWLDQAIQQPPAHEENGFNHNPDYIIENLSGVQVTHDRAAQHIFFADVMAHYPVGDKSHLEEVVFYNIEPGEPLIQINADHAELSEGMNNIYLTGDVIITREKEDDMVTMRTEFLHLIPDSEIAKTDQPVTVTRMNSILNAVGMELNNRTGHIELKSRVRAKDDKTFQRADRPSSKKE